MNLGVRWTHVWSYLLFSGRLIVSSLARGERLRIGYVSADFVNHPTADLMQSAILLHDQTSFEIFLYSISRDDTSMYRQVLQREIKNFKALPNKLSDKKCAEVIHPSLQQCFQ